MVFNIRNTMKVDVTPIPKIAALKQKQEFPSSATIPKNKNTDDKDLSSPFLLKKNEVKEEKKTVVNTLKFSKITIESQVHI